MLNATFRALFLGLAPLSGFASHFIGNAAGNAERRLLTADDINAVHEVSDPQLSPDGQWVAYVVRTADPVKDKGKSPPLDVELGRQAKHAADQLR